MSAQDAEGWTRRRFLGGLTLAGTAGFLAAQALREIPYARWREYDPEDSVRFDALRVPEVGMLKASPQKLMARAPTGASSTS